jgi:hypothetical protein
MLSRRKPPRGSLCPFWKELRASLALDCIIGCSPLVAQSSFPMAQNGQGVQPNPPPPAPYTTYCTYLPQNNGMYAKVCGWTCVGMLKVEICWRKKINSFQVGSTCSYSLLMRARSASFGCFVRRSLRTAAILLTSSTCLLICSDNVAFSDNSTAWIVFLWIAAISARE